MIFALFTMDTHILPVLWRKKSWKYQPFVWYFYIQFGHPPAVEERKYGRPLVRSWWSATVDSWRARAWDVAAHKGCIISIFNLQWHIFHFCNLDNHQHWQITDKGHHIQHQQRHYTAKFCKKTKTRKPQKIISGPNNSLIKSFTHQIGQSTCNVCYF